MKAIKEGKGKERERKKIINGKKTNQTREGKFREGESRHLNE